MINLLHETETAIAKSGHSPHDIVFIGSEDSGHQCSWEEFKLLADDEYDAGYGAQQVATDLVIVFSDGGWLARAEYDGSEWWEHVAPFQLPKSYAPIKRLVVTGRGWRTLAELNEAE